jgi:phosphohistidine phosphatase
MILHVLRHGIAVELGAPGFEKDALRTLTSEGRRKLRQVAKAIHRMDVVFDRIISSPYLRALETAEQIAASFKSGPKAESSKSLSPAGTPSLVVDMLCRLKPSPENVLVVGHEPNLSSLVSYLVGGQGNACVAFKKGGLCRLCINQLRPQPKATIEWLLTPKQMAAIASSPR